MTGTASTMADGADATSPRRHAHGRVALACAAFVASMVGMAYAAVPLYELFCRVTGFGGTTQQATAAPDVTVDFPTDVRFDANVERDVALEFRAVDRTVTVNPGAVEIVHYAVTNTSDEEIWATATFNVAPFDAGIYFNKIECFCFTEQRFAPGETVEMPVVFFLDPDIAEDERAAQMRDITLSYTFFKTDAPADALAVRAAEAPENAL